MNEMTPRKKGAVGGLISGLSLLFWLSHQKAGAGVPGRFKSRFWEGVSYGVGGVAGIILGIGTIGQITLLVEEREIRDKIRHARATGVVTPARSGTSTPAPSSGDPASATVTGASK